MKREQVSLANYLVDQIDVLESFRTIITPDNILASLRRAAVDINQLDDKIYESLYKNCKPILEESCRLMFQKLNEEIKKLNDKLENL